MRPSTTTVKEIGEIATTGNQNKVIPSNAILYFGLLTTKKAYSAGATKNRRSSFPSLLDNYFIPRRRHSTAVADFPITIRQPKTSVQILTFPELELFPHVGFDRAQTQ